MANQYPGLPRATGMGVEAFRVLQAERRRQVLIELLDAPPSRRIQVPEAIADAEDDLDDLRVRLYHHHLPVLADEGLIEWDRDEEVVARGPRFDEYEPVLELVRDDEVVRELLD